MIKKLLFLTFLFTLSSNYSTASDNFKHSISIFGDVKYPENFKNFDYVSSDMVKNILSNNVRYLEFSVFSKELNSNSIAVVSNGYSKGEFKLTAKVQQQSKSNRVSDTYTSFTQHGTTFR